MGTRVAVGIGVDVEVVVAVGSGSAVSVTRTGVGVGSTAFEHAASKTAAMPRKMNLDIWHVGE